MNALVIPLTLSKRDFATNAESARQDMERLKGEYTRANAELTIMKRDARAAGDATAAQTTQIRAQTDAVKELNRAWRSAKADHQVLSSVPAPAPAALPDESARYQAWLQRADEQERSQKAHAAMAARAEQKLALPARSGPKAVITVAEEAAEGTAAAGISRMGKQELGHVGRSLAGSMMAGVPVGDALAMEAPRLISALGPATMSAVGGLSGLAAILGPLVLVVGGAVAAFKVLEAEQEAGRTRRGFSKIGENATNLGETDADPRNPHTDWRTTERREQKRNRRDRLRLQLPDDQRMPETNVESAQDLNKDIEDAQKQVEEARKKEHGKMNRFAEWFGKGIKPSDIRDGVARKNALVEQRDGVTERDQRFARRAFNGDPGVEAARLQVELEEKLSKARELATAGKIHDGARLIAQAQEEYQLAMDTLARKQAFQKDELDLENRINAIRRDGRNVETESAKARTAKAAADLKAGPGQGPEHERLQAAVEAARLDQAEATRRDQAAHNALATEAKITAIKRAGYHVDAEIAKARMHEAQKALGNGPESGDEHDRLQQAVRDARLQLTQTERETAEKEKQFELETRIARLRGSSDQMHRAALDLEAADIERRLKIAKPDEKPALLAEQARNQQQQAEQAKNEKLRGIDDAEAGNRAAAGHGFGDQVRLLTQELQRNQERKKWNDQENGGDKHVAAQLDETAAQLKKTLDDVVFAEQQRLQALKTQQTQIQNRGYQLTATDKNRDIDTKYNAQEAEERHNKNDPAALAQMERNRGAEKFDVAVDEEMMTPAQRRARERANLRRRQAAERVQARQAAHADAQDANRSHFDEFFHGPDAHTVGGHAPQPKRQTSAAQPDRQVSAGEVMHKAAAAAGFGKGDLATCESLLNDIKERVDFKEHA